MSAYPTELIPTANGVQSYTLPARPEAIAEGVWAALSADLAAAQARISPVDRIVGAYDVLKDHVAHLDASGVAVVASCAEQIVLNHFHGKAAEALPVRDAAVALLPPPAPPEGE